MHPGKIIAGSRRLMMMTKNIFEEATITSVLIVIIYINPEPDTRVY